MSTRIDAARATTLLVMSVIGAAAALGVNWILRPARGLIGADPGSAGSIALLLLIGAVFGFLSGLAAFGWQDRKLG